MCRAEPWLKSLHVEFTTRKQRERRVPSGCGSLALFHFFSFLSACREQKPMPSHPAPSRAMPYWVLALSDPGPGSPCPGRVPPIFPGFLSLVTITPPNPPSQAPPSPPPHLEALHP